MAEVEKLKAAKEAYAAKVGEAFPAPAPAPSKKNKEQKKDQPAKGQDGPSKNDIKKAARKAAAAAKKAEYSEWGVPFPSLLACVRCALPDALSSPSSHRVGQRAAEGHGAGQGGPGCGTQGRGPAGCRGAGGVQTQRPVGRRCRGAAGFIRHEEVRAQVRGVRDRRPDAGRVRGRRPDRVRGGLQAGASRLLVAALARTARRPAVG
jgi:hypothetical protein